MVIEMKAEPQQGDEKMKNYNVYLYHDNEPITQVTARNTLDAYMKAYQKVPDEEENALTVREAWSEIQNEYLDENGQPRVAEIRASAYTGENHEHNTIYGVKIVLPDNANLDIRADYDKNGFFNVYLNGKKIY